jgi:hypothetical protein
MEGGLAYRSMKRLCLVASLVLFSACGAAEDEFRFTVRFVNGTPYSQKVEVKGTVQRTSRDGTFSHSLPFKQTVTSPALGEQRVSVQDPFEAADVLVLYRGDCLSFTALTPSAQSVGAWEGLALSHDVECTLVREGDTPDGSEGSVKCDTEPLPEEQADLEGKPGACDAVREAQPEP